MNCLRVVRVSCIRFSFFFFFGLSRSDSSGGVRAFRKSEVITLLFVSFAQIYTVSSAQIAANGPGLCSGGNRRAWQMTKECQDRLHRNCQPLRTKLRNEFEKSHFTPPLHKPCVVSRGNPACVRGSAVKFFFFPATCLREMNFVQVHSTTCERTSIQKFSLSHTHKTVRETETSITR